MLLINKGEYTQFGKVFGPKIYAYIGGIFVLTAIGFWIQTYMVPAKKEEEKPADPNATTNANPSANPPANTNPTNTQPQEKLPENLPTNIVQPTQAATEVPSEAKVEPSKPVENAGETEVKAV
jgi:hypothetical protein